MRGGGVEMCQELGKSHRLYGAGLPLVPVFLSTACTHQSPGSVTGTGSPLLVFTVIRRT